MRVRIASVCLCAALASCLHSTAGLPQAATAAVSAVRESQIAPDGRSVAFTFQVASPDTRQLLSTNVWMVPFAGGPPTQLTSGDRRAFLVRWSPDGRQIAFLSSAATGAATAQLITMLADGGRLRVLTSDRAGVKTFQWSANSLEIAYLAEGGGAARLEIVDVESGRTRTVTTPRDGAAAAFAWSPGAAEFVLAIQQPRRPSRLMVQPLSGEGRELKLLDGQVTGLTWSPDGAAIACLTMGVGGSRIEVVAPDGRSLASVGSPNNPPNFFGWNADGWLSIVERTDGETIIDLLNVLTRARRSILPPGIVRITDSPSWSGDGTRYAVVGSGRDHGPEVFAGSLPLPMSNNPDFVGAPPPPVRRITFLTR